MAWLCKGGNPLPESMIIAACISHLSSIYWRIVALWHHMATKIWVNTGSGNGLLLVTRLYQAITWTPHFDILSVKSSNIHQRTISKEITQPPITKICWKTADLKFIKIAKSLTHLGRVTHIYVGNLTVIGSDNGFLPGGPQAIFWPNAWISITGHLETNVSSFIIKIHEQAHLKISSTEMAVTMSRRQCANCLTLATSLICTPLKLFSVW